VAEMSVRSSRAARCVLSTDSPRHHRTGWRSCVPMWHSPQCPVPCHPHSPTNTQVTSVMTHQWCYIDS